MTNFYATIARYYDSEHADKTEDQLFYSEMAEEYGAPILIIGSGTGRVALNLAQEGYEVHGIEIEPAMLERAQRKLDSLPDLRDQVTFHAGDALKIKLDQQFKLAIIPYNTLMHFYQNDAQRTLLKRLRKWVSQGGALVIDLPNAGEAFAAQDNEALTLERSFLELESGHLIMQQSVSRLDRAEQLMEVTWIYDEIGDEGELKRTVVPVLIRYFFFEEMRLLLELCGFEVADVFGDFDRIPFEDGVPRMLIVAK
ncbi:MAG TPA: class I SAM-dependent methyltransferase [Phototrophicaceae bacterium]|nr:class I SAM-dependent methyltransferase [Phototrophicaceae bacterium]